MQILKKILLLAIVFLPCLQSFAQKEFPKQRSMMTEDQKDKIKSLQKDLDEKINAAFKSDPKLKMQMDAELKKIATIKDEKIQKLAAAKYQDTYLTSYTKILAKAKVDLAEYAQQMQIILPWFKFVVDKRLFIRGFAMLELAPFVAPPAGPVSKTISGFTTNKQVSCGLGAGGDVTFTDNSMKANVVAAVAGCCDANGSMSFSSSLNGAEHATFTVKYKARVEGFAIGVIGTAAISAKSSGILQLSNIYNIEVFVLAPIAWVGYDERIDESTKTIIKDGFNLYDIDFFTFARACAALPSETHGSASVKDIEVLLVTK